jgi:hypothetical protein
MNGYLAFEYTPKGAGYQTRKYVALPVVATHIEGTDDSYGIMPAGDLPEDYDARRDYDGRLKSWPYMERLGQRLYWNEHEVYAYWMRAAGHRQGEMEGALASYKREQEMWRGRWIEATKRSEADADKMLRTGV